MLKKLLVFLALVLFFSTAFAVLAPISVEREVTGTVKHGETTQVKLHLKFIGEKPSGIIVTEYVPEGWKVTSSIPAGTNFEDHTSWLVYGDAVKDFSIVYELKAPENLAEPALLNGVWETLAQTGFIEGDLIVNLTLEETLPAPPTPPQEPLDNTLMYAGIAGVIVVLVIVIAVLAVKKKKK